MVEAQTGVELVGEDGAVDAPAAGAGAGGIAALDEEGFDDAVEEGAVVVALEAELDEVADRLGRLLRPQLDVQGAVAGVDHHLPPCRRLQIVHARHLCLSPPMESGRHNYAILVIKLRLIYLLYISISIPLPLCTVFFQFFPIYRSPSQVPVPSTSLPLYSSNGPS